MITDTLHLRLRPVMSALRPSLALILAFVACQLAAGCSGSSPSVPPNDAAAIEKAVVDYYGDKDKAIEVVNVEIKSFDGASAVAEATLKWPEFHSVAQKRDAALKKEGGKWVVVSVEEK